MEGEPQDLQGPASLPPGGSDDDSDFIIIRTGDGDEGQSFSVESMLTGMEAADLRAYCRTVMEERDKLRVELEECTDRLDKVTDRYTKLKQENSEKCVQAHAAVTRLNEEKRCLIEQITELQMNIQGGATSASISQENINLKLQLQSLNTNYTALRDQNAQLTAKNHELTEGLEEYRRNLEACQQSYQQLLVERSSAVTNSEGRINTDSVVPEGERQHSEEDYEAILAKCSRLEDQLQDLLRENHELKQKNQSRENSYGPFIQHLKEESSDKDRQIEELKQHLAQAEQSVYENLPPVQQQPSYRAQTVHDSAGVRSRIEAENQDLQGRYEAVWRLYAESEATLNMIRGDLVKQLAEEKEARQSDARHYQNLIQKERVGRIQMEQKVKDHERAQFTMKEEVARIETEFLAKEKNYTEEIKRQTNALENFDKQTNQLLNDNMKLEREIVRLKQEGRGWSPPSLAPHQPQRVEAERVPVPPARTPTQPQPQVPTNPVISSCPFECGATGDAAFLSHHIETEHPM